MLLRAGACVPASCFKLSLRCTCGSLQCGVSNDHTDDTEKDLLGRPPSQLEMCGLAVTSASAKARESLTDDFRQRVRSQNEVFLPIQQRDDRSTDTGTGSSCSSNSEIILPSDEPEEGWHTPADSCADSRDFGDLERHHNSNAVASALAAALAPPLPPRQDWWDYADPHVVPGLEAVPSLTRLLSAEHIRHLGLEKSRHAPWMRGESHSLYRKLGVRVPDKTYMALWLNTGDQSIVSTFDVIDRPALERCLDDDALGKRMKLLIKAVKCSLPFPGKGPKDADTVGHFFGKGASLTRSYTPDGAEVVVAQIDLYSVTILRWALQSVGFRKGNVIDVILVDWPGQAVLASYRLAVTDSFLKHEK